VYHISRDLPALAVRLEGANPPRELSIDLVADQRPERRVGIAVSSDASRRPAIQRIAGACERIGSYPIVSGSHTMKLSRFGIFTYGKVLASITSS